MANNSEQTRSSSG